MLMSIQLVLLTPSGHPCTPCLLCPLPLLLSGSDLVWLVWFLAREGTQLIRSPHTHHSKPPCQAYHLELSDFCVLLRLLDKSSNSYNIQRKEKGDWKICLKLFLCLNSLCCHFSTDVPTPDYTLWGYSLQRLLWLESPSTPLTHLLSQDWSSDFIDLKLISFDIDENLIIVRDFNTTLKSKDRSSRQKINKAKGKLNDTLEQLDLIFSGPNIQKRQNTHYFQVYMEHYLGLT